MSAAAARFRRIDELFRAALPLPPLERSAMLRSSGDDASVIAEVEALLAEDAGALDLERAVSQLAAEAAADGAPAAPHEPGPAPVVPGYTLVRLLGRGGMGEVYEAEQSAPRRRVALKVIRPEAVSPAMLRRFELEAEFLARLDHPGIATIFETGTTGEGASRRPYLAMELVDGVPLTDHAAARGLPVPGRLELFCAVCDAVRHAHERGVIHRDLKPANILVRADGQARVVDFGVARATGPDLATLVAGTQDGQVIGTLSYMSPEQLRGDTGAVDTRSDVYALGVVLFELLTGELPHGAADGSLYAMVRKITETEAPRLSSISPGLRGDLDVIAAKALAKLPAERYAGVAELAADVRRHLRDEPILARPATAAYQIRKFARRNRGLVAAAGLTAFALVAATAVSIGFALSENRQRRTAQEALGLADERLALANRKTAAAQAINDFLNEGLLAAAAPGNLGRGVLLLDAFELAAADIDGRFEGEPSVEAAIRSTIGDTYFGLGLAERGEPHLRRAVELSTAALGPEDPDTLTDMTRLANTCRALAKFEEAESLYTAVLAGRERVLGKDDPLTITSLQNLANLLRAQSRLEASRPLFDELLTRATRALPEDSPERVHAVEAVAGLYKDLHRYHEAKTLYTQVLAARRRLHAPDHPRLLDTMNNLALVHDLSGDPATAETIYVDVLAAMRRTLGDRHPATINTIQNLARLYGRSQTPEKAGPLFEECVAGSREVLGPGSPRTIQALYAYSGWCLKAGRVNEAIDLAREAMDSAQEAMGPAAAPTLLAMHGLGRALGQSGDHDAAASVLGELVSTARPTEIGRQPAYLIYLHAYADALIEAGRLPEAEVALREAQEILGDRETNGLLGRVHIHRLFFKLYERWDKPEQAAKYREASAAPAAG